MKTVTAMRERSAWREATPVSANKPAAQHLRVSAASNWNKKESGNYALFFVDGKLLQEYTIPSVLSEKYKNDCQTGSHREEDKKDGKRRKNRQNREAG